MMQAGFARALLDPDCAVPAGLVTPDGGIARRRFAVYRNNVVVSLVEAAKAAFPTLLHLLGQSFFEAMARCYVSENAPESRCMAQFGASMPGFLAGFAPVAQLPYLPDIARLDLAMRRSYHAADSTPVDLSDWPPQRLMRAQVQLAPSLRLVRSPFPVFGIWQATRGGPPPAAAAQDVAILRPGFDPAPHLLPQGGAGMIAALHRGVVLEHAAHGLDGAALTQVLTCLIENNALISLEEKDGDDDPSIA